MRIKIASAWVIAAFTLCSSVAVAATIKLSSQLSASQEVPPVASADRGGVSSPLSFGNALIYSQVVFCSGFKRGFADRQVDQSSQTGQCHVGDPHGVQITPFGQSNTAQIGTKKSPDLM